MEHDSSRGIDLLTVALPQECLEIILSYIDMLSRINLLETSKFFAAWFATQDWKRSVTEFLKDSNGVNYNQTPPNINWRVIAKRVARINEWRSSVKYEVLSSDVATSLSTRQALIDGLPPVCKQLHATLPKERQLIALSNEYIVYQEPIAKSPMMLVHVYRIQPTECVHVKSIKRCLAYYWAKELNIVVLLKIKGVVKLNLKDATQECTRILVWRPKYAKYGGNKTAVHSFRIEDVREMNIKGEVTLVAIATASTGTAFVDLTNRRLIKFVEFAKTPQWLYGSKVAVLFGDMAIIDIAEPDKKKCFIAHGIQYTTPILDFVPNKSGCDMFIATLANRALEIRVCLWPLRMFVDTGIRIPAAVVPTLELQLNEEDKTIIINDRARVKLSKWLE